VGALLAQRLGPGWRFYEGDAFHPQANVDKMRSGRPLDDDDRAPWLHQLAAIIQQHLRRCARRQGGCAALLLLLLHGRAAPLPGTHSRTPLPCSPDEGAVLSCSALKPAYRRLLSPGHPDPRVAFVSSQAGLARRLRAAMPGRLHDASLGGGGGRHADPHHAAACCSAQPPKQLPANQPALRLPPPSRPQVLLDPSPAELQRRLELRAAQGGHFMPPQLLASQLAALQYAEQELFMHVVAPPPGRGGAGGAGGGASVAAGLPAADDDDPGASEERASGGGGAASLDVVGSFPGPAEVVEMVLAKLLEC
jgi:gluconate kinase